MNKKMAWLRAAIAVAGMIILAWAYAPEKRETARVGQEQSQRKNGGVSEEDLY